MIHSTATQGIPTLAQQVQAASAAARAQACAAFSRAARFGPSSSVPQRQGALHRQCMLAELAARGSRTVRQLRDAIASAPVPGTNPDISHNAVASLAVDMYDRRWLGRALPSRTNTPVGMGRAATYYITDLGRAALAAMREANTTPATTGDH